MPEDPEQSLHVGRLRMSENASYEPSEFTLVGEFNEDTLGGGAGHTQDAERASWRPINKSGIFH